MLTIEEIKKIDSKSMYSVYDRWPKIAEESYSKKIPKIDIKDINHVVFAGMGGSGAIGDIFSSILSKNQIHVSIVKGYHLPKTVNSRTLVVCTSISGETNETLSILENHKNSTGKFIAFSSGGKMEDYSKKNNIEFYKIKKEHSPRASFLGFLYSTLNVLEEIIPISESEVKESIRHLFQTKNKIHTHSLNSENEALKLAHWIKNIPIIYYPWGLQSAAIRFKNSMQENSKKHVLFEDVIEASHNGIVSMATATLSSQQLSSATHSRPEIREKSLARHLMMLAGSLKITVVMFLAATFLLFIGTLAQDEKNLPEVKAEYFNSWIAKVPFSDFFPVTVFGESAGGHNVYSLLVSEKAKGLFHKAIAMSGYTTSISQKDAYKQNKKSSTSDYSSWEVVNNITNGNQADMSKEEIRKTLLSLSGKEFFEIYANRESYQELPLLTRDDIVIPAIGLREALSKNELINNVPLIAGSNADEVKLWLATAEYFVDLEYSFIGSILNIPKVKLNNEDAFEAFNYYRSASWKIRGVDEPLRSLHEAKNTNLYAYRFDWDDHRRRIVGDFKKLIGAAHATEIPLLAGNTELVGGFPLSNLIYPASFSKSYTSKNMMKFWSNFAKNGSPGISSNSILWEPYDLNSNNPSFIILDKKSELKMSSDSLSFKSLAEELYKDTRVNELEKCVILLQMFTFVGDDLYENNIGHYPGTCDRNEASQFIKDNASFIEF